MGTMMTMTMMTTILPRAIRREANAPTLGVAELSAGQGVILATVEAVMLGVTAAAVSLAHGEGGAGGGLRARAFFA